MKTKTLVLLFITANLFAVADSNLVAWYKMDDNADSTVVLDSSGNGYHGTSDRNTSLMHTAGKIGGAFKFEDDVITKFDGKDYYLAADGITVYNQFETLCKDSFTISFFIKAGEGLEIGCNVFSLSTVIFGISEGKISAYYNDGVNQFIYLSPNVVVSQAGNFVMITGVFEKLSTSTMKFTAYVNGNILSESGVQNITMNNWETGDNLNIGGDTITTSVTLDDIRIYNKALTEAEVRQLYSRGGPKVWIGDEDFGNF